MVLLDWLRQKWHHIKIPPFCALVTTRLKILVINRLNRIRRTKKTSSSFDDTLSDMVYVLSVISNKNNIKHGRIQEIDFVIIKWRLKIGSAWVNEADLIKNNQIKLQFLDSKTASGPCQWAVTLCSATTHLFRKLHHQKQIKSRVKWSDSWFSGIGSLSCSRRQVCLSQTTWLMSSAHLLSFTHPIQLIDSLLINTFAFKS